MPASAATVAAAAAPTTTAMAAAAPTAATTATTAPTTMRRRGPIVSATPVSDWRALITTIPTAVARARRIPPSLPGCAGNILQPRLLPRLQPAGSRIIGLAKAV